MKNWLTLTAVVLGTAVADAQAQTAAPAAARVQPTNAPPANAQPARANQSLQAQAPGPLTLSLPSFELTKANEITVGKLNFSGVAVQVIKARSPLQLFNPAAPARYGSGRDNLVSFPFMGLSPRLKFLSLDF